MPCFLGHVVYGPALQCASEFLRPPVSLVRYCVFRVFQLCLPHLASLYSICPWYGPLSRKSQKLIPEVEDIVVDDETYKQKWESAQRLNKTLSQRLSAQGYANAVVTERLNASNLRMAMLPVPQLKELLEADVSKPSALLSKALYEQRDYGCGLKYFKGEFSTWQEPAKGSINMQSYAKIISPGLCISPAEQTEAKALEELWKTTKGMVYKPNPPVEVAGIEVVARSTIPKKSGFTSSPGAAATYASAASRSSSSSTTISRMPSSSYRRSTSPLRKRRATNVIRYNGPYRFWLICSPRKEEFMNEAHTCWMTFGRLLVTKVVQRLQKVSQTRPNGFKTPQKGSGKTKPTT